MFIIMLAYKKPMIEIEKHLEAHRMFLDKGYKDGLFIVSGPKSPRNGGIIISQSKKREQLENMIKQDPFHIHDLADYEIIEFIPTKYNAGFSCFIDQE